MPWPATALLMTFLFVVFPLRSAIHAGHRRVSRRADWQGPRPRSWKLADLLFVAGFSTLLAGAVLEGLGAVAPLVDPRSAQLASGVLMILGATALALWSQAMMGPAWRPDIPPVADGDLVTTGPFSVVRNPNYAAMLAAGLGAALLAPNGVVFAGWVVLLASLLLTARAEEPLLLDRYGTRYRDYAESVGRFVPGIGRLRR